MPMDNYEKLEFRLYMGDMDFDLAEASEHRRAYRDAFTYYQSAKNSYEKARICAIAVKNGAKHSYAKSRITICNNKISENMSHYNAVKSDDPGFKQKNDYIAYTK